uniref:Uncharacterized protein n=1 Tax=Rhizophora mucronata TaxID=61149 RepID=A0A2P2PTW3_RHIMU
MECLRSPKNYSPELLLIQRYPLPLQLD